MPFHHEKLNVYQRTLQFVTWSQELIDSLTKKVSTRDQLERAGDSIALNIAEGNGKFSSKDRARFFQMAHGSALECAACLDLFVARHCCSAETITPGKELLEQIVKMLFKMLDQLGCRIAEDSPEYLVTPSDPLAENPASVFPSNGRKQGKSKRKRKR